MQKVIRGNFPFYKFSNLAACPGVVHFVSSGIKDIGFSEEKEEDVIRKNRKELAAVVGFDGDKWVTAHQIHSTNVAVVTSADAGRGAWDKESRLPDTDALITNEESICLMVLSADCVPVLLYDPVCQVSAAIHAGWRGTVAGIVKETVKIMKKMFGCRPENILAGIGPSIGKCCFEVGEEVAEAFNKEFRGNKKIVYMGRQPGKYQVDLWEANRQELTAIGVLPEHIEIAGMCSVCHSDHFFSYRRDGKKAGRFGAGIVLSGR